MKNINDTNPLYVRGIISTIKIVFFTIALILLIKLSDYQPIDVGNFTHWCLVVIALAIVASSFVDVHMESMDLVGAFTMLPAMIIFIVALFDIATALWTTESNASVSSPTYVVFLAIHLSILSGNDRMMDSFASRYFYRRSYPRNARYLVYLLFNTVPYLIGYYGFIYSLTYFETKGAWVFVVLFASINLVFIAYDEFLRHKRHWSFFWVNRPDRNHYSMKAEYRK